MDTKNKKPVVFVITPFTDAHLELYKALKNEFENLYEFVNAGDTGNVQNILKDIIQPIYDADIILADLTGLNSNVMYELGIAHTMNKKTIMITQDNLDGLPFDLKQYRTQRYTTHFTGFNNLRSFLSASFDSAIKGSAVFSNPVQDFLSTTKISNVICETTNPEEESEDKGFIDFLADLYQASEKLGNEITNMTNDMNLMSDGVDDCSQKIEKQKNAVLIQASVKKAANYISDFSTKLKSHNTTIQQAWKEIEVNTLGLVENKYTLTGSNKNELIEYLKQLYALKDSIVQSQTGLMTLKGSFNDALGLQKAMNHAIKSANPNFDEYINITNDILTSIDRILNKSKFAVGDIDFSQEAATESSDE